MEKTGSFRAPNPFIRKGQSTILEDQWRGRIKRKMEKKKREEGRHEGKKSAREGG